LEILAKNGPQSLMRMGLCVIVRLWATLQGALCCQPLPEGCGDQSKDLPPVAGTPRIGACVGNVGKFICIGLNYSDHAAESGMAFQ
jgi:2-keto-4-pentenoate hydratase/2-oxohepta-3-ene-1,7-dioic acid hydratase in catechol pathway